MRSVELERLKREHDKDLQKLQSFRPLDDCFMRCLLRDNISLAQHILRIILQKKDLTILSIETQADMKCLLGARSICLDAYAADDTGRKYDIEIQRADAGVFRARYTCRSDKIFQRNAGRSESYV